MGYINHLGSNGDNVELDRADSVARSPVETRPGMVTMPGVTV